MFQWPAAAQDACELDVGGRQTVTSVRVVVHTIHIKVNYAHDTTVLVNPDFNLAVTNAPTSLDFLTTYDSRSTAIRIVDA